MVQRKGVIFLTQFAYFSNLSKNNSDMLRYSMDIYSSFKDHFIMVYSFANDISLARYVVMLSHNDVARFTRNDAMFAPNH